MTADPLDCSPSLTAKGFAYPPIPYNTFGSYINIAPSYESVFDHSLKPDCLLYQCMMSTQADCSIPLPAQTDVLIRTSPFGLDASEKNPYGFTLIFCYRCEIEPTG